MINLYEADERLFNNNGLEILDDIIISAEVERTLNGSFFANVRALKDTLNKHEKLKEERIITLYTPSGVQPFRIVDINPVNGTYIDLVVKQVVHDINKRVVKRCKVASGNGAFALNKFKNSLDEPIPHNLTSDITTNASFDWIRKKALNILIGDDDNSFLSKYGGELDVNGFNVSINKRIGTDRGFIAKYKKNIKGFNALYTTTSLITRIIPIGYDGITLTDNAHVDSPNLNNFNDIYCEVVEFKDIKYKNSPNNSEAEGYETLEEAQQALITACNDYFTNSKCDQLPFTADIDVAMLKDTIEYKDTAIFEEIQLGDDVLVDIEDSNIKTKQRMTYYKYNSLTRKYITITLGLNIDDYFKEINNSLKDTVSKDELNNELGAIIDKAFQEVNDKIQNGGNLSYIKFLPSLLNPSEIIACDNEELDKAVYVVRINKAGLGVSTTGYNGTYQGLITEGKLALNEMTCRQFTAALIRTGMLSDATGKTWINMDNGNFNFADKIKFDGTNFSIQLGNGNSVEQEIQDSINNYKDTVNKELDDIKDAMDNLGDTLDEAFKDGIIDEAEAIAIKQQIQNLEIEKKDIDSVYNSLYSNADLTGIAKNNLYNAKASYNTAHTNLINAINYAIADKKISTDENTLVKRAFANYGTALATFRTKSEEALDAIANKKKQDAIQYTDTQFNILDGKIQSKITSADAQSIAEQTVNSFKHEVSNTYISKENADDSFLSKDQASSLTAGLQKNLIIGGNFKLQVFDSWDNSRKRNIEFYTTTTGLAGITVREWNYEGWIYSNHVNVKAMNSNKISFAVKMKVESNLRGAEVFLGHYGANKNLIREVWIGDASAGFEGEIGREGYTIPSDVYYIALRIDHNGLKRNTDSNVVLFLEYINLVEGDTVPHTFLQDDGISLKESYSKIEQTADGIKQTVSKKVNSDEIISAINQTAEVIQIQASRINLDGYVFVSSQLKAPHITGSALVYIEEGGILSCDGETYATKLYITNLARDCYFSSDAPAYFNNTLLAKKGLTATDRIHAKNGLSVTDGITATGNMILNGYTVIKNNSLGVESNIYCTNGTIEAKYLKVNNSATVSGTLSVGSTLYVGGSLEVKNYGTTLAQLEVNGTTTLKGYTVIKNNSLGVEGFIYCNGNIEALQSGRGQINCNYLGSMGNIACRGTLSGSNLSISGSKNCVQETKNYGKRLVNAYETADYLFGDVGESIIENGECIVYLDDIFKEVITTDITYQVFLTKYGKGDIWVSERHEDYFIVQGDNDIPFGWEIKAKRKGYENYRLEEYVEEIEDEKRNNTV